MITHDVDEAVLLSDRIVMLTNGPNAQVGEVLDVDLPRPRDRIALATTRASPSRARRCWSSCTRDAHRGARPYGGGHALRGRGGAAL
jgi:ABC-type nitrate/sulfonate/bicarbonate transport system ATPase subunit